MFTSIATTASREENAVNSLVRMAKNKRNSTPNKRPNLTKGTISAKSKGPIINALVPLIRQVVTQDTDLQYFIISLYDETSNDKYTVDLFSGKTYEQARAIIEVHAKMFSKTFYRGSKPQANFNLNEDNVVNLAYLMYLDMIHDGTINGESFKKPKNNNGEPNVIPQLKFNNFCEENIVLPVKVPVVINGKKTKKFKIIQKKQKSPVFILFGKAITPKETPFIKRIQEFGGEESGAELAIKNNLPSIHLKSDGTSYLPKYKEINRDQIKSNILKEDHNLFMGIDQEDEKATVTLNIAKTKYNYTKTNGTTGSAKIFYPLVSVANLMDPGKNMLIESAKENTKYLMQAKGSIPLSRMTWNYKQPSFRLVMNHGTTVISTYYTDEVKIVNTGNNKKKTKRGYEYTINNANNNDAERVLSSSMSKAQAQVGTSNDRVAKFMGDFMQALTMCAHIKNNTLNTGNPKYNYCLATGDAMLCNSFIFMCSISGTTPNLWMPISKQQTSLVYGDMLNNFRTNKTIQSEPTEVVNANVRRTPNRSNGARSNGSGYAKPISLNSISAGSLAGSTVASNNNGNNEIQSPNRGRIILNKQLREKGLNSTNINALLKNYKNGMNVNRVITKANTIVLNKKKAENKKNLNQRLRKKGLNSTNINALLKNYNNGMNVNRVITKANTIVSNKKKAENKKNLNQRLRAKGLNNNTVNTLLKNYNNGKLNFNGAIAKANNIISRGSNPAEMNLGAAIMSGQGMKRPRNNANLEAQIANLQAQLARSQAAALAAATSANAAARNARNASNAQAARNAAAKNAAAKKAANEANAKAKRVARALKQLGANQQGPRRSTRPKKSN
jgi:hypothetical protein